MKNICFTLFICMYSCSIYALQASVEFYRYSTIDEQYLEVNYRIFRNTLSVTDAKQDGSLEILSTIIITQDGKVVDYQKNALLVNETPLNDILDVKRFILSPGQYTVTVELENQSAIDGVFKIEKTIEILTPQSRNVSDIMLLATVKPSDDVSNMVKSGLYLEVQPYSFFGPEKSILSLYVEMYGMLPISPSDKYYFSYQIIEGFENNDGEVLMTKFKRLETADIQPFLLNMDIDSLASGDYHMLITAYDQNKNMFAQKSANFVRSNPKADVKKLSRKSYKIENSFVHLIAEDSLDYYLQALSPVIDLSEKEVLDEVLKSKNIKTKQLMLHDYWYQRGKEFAEQACASYMKIARAVDQRFFNGTSRGFDTDLGYIFLRYGKPDDAMTVDDELSAFPYQIWRYNRIDVTGENNVKFLFYAPSLSHRDFRLLHSTCRVEYQNPAWELELYKKIPEEQIGNGGDAREVNDGFTRRAKDLWNDF